MLKDTSGILLERCYMLYLLLFFTSLICLWYHIDFSHFKWNHHFTIWSNLVFCIIFVMIIFIYIYVWMNILILINYLHSEKSFPPIFDEENIWYQQEHPWCLSYNGNYSGVSCSNFLIFWLTWFSPACLYHVAIK